MHPSPAVRARAWRSLSNIAAAMRVCSAKVERKHLLGQECKAGKSRGRAPDCKTLGKRTYQKSVSEMANRLQAAVKKGVIGLCPKLQRKFGQTLSSFRIGKSRKRKRDALGNLDVGARGSRESDSKLRPLRAYDAFVSAKFKDVGGESFTVKRARVNQVWNNLPAADKAVWKGIAATENDKCDSLRGQDFKAFHQGRTATFNKTREKTLKRKAVATTMAKMQNHSAWKAGFQTASYSGGLKTELVSQMTDRQLDDFSTDVFGFDKRIVQNPKRTMKPFTVCGIRHGGLCCRDALSSKGDIGTRNLYISLGPMKKDLPLFVRLAILDPLCSADHFLAKTHGRGDAIVLVEAKVRQQAFDDGAWGVATLLDESGSPVVKTFHMLLRSLVRKARIATPDLNLMNVTSLRLTCFHYKDHPTADHFAVRLLDVAKQCDISLTASLAMPQNKKVKPKVVLPFGFSCDDLPDFDSVNEAEC